jgi:hypothetical protein
MPGLTGFVRRGAERRTLRAMDKTGNPRCRSPHGEYGAVRASLHFAAA